ncbi:hypothetical protein JL193_14780 [Polaribacter batillariae]|uniref:FAS1 domain-containing protein n=1 Tax=Polaribacter batillariae TaxID=2808900 RepID=A0ABX7STY0_9FLAO|nr:hypothetical protein [Polaribacter batillariae]QTD37347.1 hypothetical protein JL193_14780 [Polaribacter batillariae]
MKNTWLVIIILISLYACSSEEQIIDGGLSNGNVNATTFDFLKSHKQLDTLAILIEKAGLKDKVNEQTTLFAANNTSINRYVNSVLSKMRQTDPEATFTVDDIHVDTLKKYMGSYIFNVKIKRENMTKEGSILTSSNGEKRRISLEPVDKYNNYLESRPEYVYYTYKGGDTWEDWDDVNSDDESVLVRTSNITTLNGVVHVLQGTHVLFNYKNN